MNWQLKLSCMKKTLLSRVDQNLFVHLSNHCPRQWMSEQSDLPGFLSMSEVSHDDFHSAAIQSVPGCVSAPAVTKVTKDAMNVRITYA